MFLVVSYIFWKVISSVVRNVTRHYIIIPLHVLAQISFCFAQIKKQMDDKEI